MIYDPTAGPRQEIEIPLRGRVWRIIRSADMEGLWESMGREDFGPDERPPYWADIWPSSLVLGEWLGENRGLVAGRLCLDLGCGLGLSALVGAGLGGRVVGMDYEWPALFFARLSMERNCGPGAEGRPAWVMSDWRAPSFRPGAFELAWAGEVMYERRFVEPASLFLDRVLAPGGRAWLAGPNRGAQSEFRLAMRELGFQGQKRLTRSKPHFETGVEVEINVWEFSRAG